MLRATFRNLFARKLRLTLSAIAVVLGVAFVSGTYVLTDTINATFTSLFSDANRSVDVGVQAKSAFTQNGNADREPLPESVLATVKAVPGVADAIGNAGGYAQLVGPDNKPVGGDQAPAIGVSWSGSPLDAKTIVQGHGPLDGTQIAIDEHTASAHHLAVGEKVKVLLAGPSKSVTISGVFRFGSGGSLAGATLTAFDVKTAQQVFNLAGKYNTVLASAEPGVSQDTLLQRIQAVIPKNAEALTGQELADQQSSQITDSFSGFSTFLLVFAYVALFVGAFIIANTFQMLVAQRTRELALMRAVGASRGQVTRSVLLEAFVVGLIGSTIGLGLGVLIALGLKGVFSLIGIDLPAGGLVFKPRTAIVCYLVGTLITMAAAYLPARKASRVPPVAAMRESWVEPQKSLRRRTLVGGIAVLAGIGLLALGLNGGTLPLVGLGALVVFLGVAQLSPVLSGPVIRVIGAPFQRLFGITGRLAEQNALRNPRRTSATASALMIGLALVATFSIMGDSLKSSFRTILRNGLVADYVVQPDSQNNAGFSNSVAATLQQTPGVDVAAGITGGPAAVNGSVKSMQAMDPAKLSSVLNLTTKEGNLQSIGQNKIAISDTTADNEHFHLGQTLSVQFARTGVQKMQVGAIYKTNQLAGDYLISEAFARKNFTQSLDFVVLVKMAGTPTAQSQAALTKALSAYPNVKVQTQAEFLHDADQQINQLLGLIFVLLALAIFIALLGIVNTLALSIVERTREIGLLRSVGMSRKQLRRSIRIEAGIIATYGAILGLVVGLGFGWALVQSLKSQGLSEFSIPVPLLVIALLAAAFFGTLAAVWPARRAAKLDVLEAISSL
jgi:putative ABC transport system permease protein